MQTSKVQIIFPPFFPSPVHVPVQPLPPLMFTVMTEFKRRNRGEKEADVPMWEVALPLSCAWEPHLFM